MILSRAGQQCWNQWPSLECQQQLTVQKSMAVNFRVYTDFQHERLLWNLNLGSVWLLCLAWQGSSFCPCFTWAQERRTPGLEKLCDWSQLDLLGSSPCTVQVLTSCLVSGNREPILQSLSGASWEAELTFSTRRSAFDEEGIYAAYFLTYFLDFFFLKDQQVDLRKHWASKRVPMNGRSV